MTVPADIPRARPGPEQQARAAIDAQLEEAGWAVQDREEAAITAAPGVAVREFKLADGHGFADYLLFVEGSAVCPRPDVPTRDPCGSGTVWADSRRVIAVAFRAEGDQSPVLRLRADPGKCPRAPFCN